MLHAVCFDLDGTIIDSKEGIFRSIAYSLERLHLSMPSEDKLFAFLGPPIADGFKKVCHVPGDSIAEAVRLYREYYNNGGMYEASVYNGVIECMQSLHNLGLRVYITTSKPAVYAKSILSHFDILSCFDGVYGCELDGTRSKKSEVIRYCFECEGLDYRNVILVGDRHFDVQGAKECGIDCIGVTYGYGSQMELLEAGANYIVENMKDCAMVISALYNKE